MCTSEHSDNSICNESKWSGFAAQLSFASKRVTNKYLWGMFSQESLTNFERNPILKLCWETYSFVEVSWIDWLHRSVRAAKCIFVKTLEPLAPPGWLYYLLCWLHVIAYSFPQKKPSELIGQKWFATLQTNTRSQPWNPVASPQKNSKWVWGLLRYIFVDTVHTMLIHLIRWSGSAWKEQISIQGQLPYFSIREFSREKIHNQLMGWGGMKCPHPFVRSAV